jgi:hypothetical protein
MDRKKMQIVWLVLSPEHIAAAFNRVTPAQGIPAAIDDSLNPLSNWRSMRHENRNPANIPNRTVGTAVEGISEGILAEQ